MKLNELTPAAYQHAYRDVYGAAGDLCDDTPAARIYREACEDMQNIIDVYCKETGADVRTPRVWGSVFYDLSFYDMGIYDGYDDTPAPLQLSGCDSDNAYAMCEYVNAEMKEDYTTAFYARLALDYISDYENATDYRTQEWFMGYDEMECVDAFDGVNNKRNEMFARLVVDYDDGNATYAYSEDSFETWAYDHDFDENGDLIS